MQKLFSGRYHIQARGRLAGLSLVAGILISICLIAGSLAYAATPGAVRHPQADHAHIRLVMVVNGTAIHFNSAAFQSTIAEQCSAALQKQPFAFQGNTDQLVHVYWRHMTGGMLLKYYGWNTIGGTPRSLGFTTDGMHLVGLHGGLPAVAADMPVHLYIGSSQRYSETSFKDFTSQDLETFFDKSSSFPRQQQASILDSLFPKASAHGGVDDGDDNEETSPNDYENKARTPAAPAAPAKTSEQQAAEKYNLLGNVVIFVQKNPPTANAVAQQFNHLQAFPAHTCSTS